MMPAGKADSQDCRQGVRKGNENKAYLSDRQKTLPGKTSMRKLDLESNQRLDPLSFHENGRAKEPEEDPHKKDGDKKGNISQGVDRLLAQKDLLTGGAVVVGTNMV